jgi:large subunit ribosomal protein L6
MSRVGKRLITVPSGVAVTVNGREVSVKGPKGQLSGTLPPSIDVVVENEQVRLLRPDDRKQSRALHGLARALVANMVKGVTDQFSKELEIQGVGYRAEVQGKTLRLSVGHSNPVEMEIPDGVKATVDRNVLIKIEGPNRGQVGQFAAEVRAVRPPEPYKGKGIRYVAEHVRRKVGKAGATAA